MRRIDLRDVVVLSLFLVVVVIGMLFANGCQERNQRPRNLPENWVKVFGDSNQSALELKLARTQALHRKILTALADRIGKLEDGAIMDGDMIYGRGPDTYWFEMFIYKVDPNDPNDPNDTG